jgi:DNA-binding MarR family transcriptional regulator
MSGPSVEKRQDVVKPSRTPAGDALSEFVVHVFRLNGLLTAAGDAMAAPAGQTNARWRVLAAIEDAPLTVPQVARAWWLSRQSVQRVADVLAEEGLAVFEDNPGHRRSKLLRITPQGLSALGTIREAQGAWADELGQELGETELRAANAILAQVVTALARRAPTAQESGNEPAR